MIIKCRDFETKKTKSKRKLKVGCCALLVYRLSKKYHQIKCQVGNGLSRAISKVELVTQPVTQISDQSTIPILSVPGGG